MHDAHAKPPCFRWIESSRDLIAVVFDVDGGDPAVTLRSDPDLALIAVLKAVSHGIRYKLVDEQRQDGRRSRRHGDVARGNIEFDLEIGPDHGRVGFLGNEAGDLIDGCPTEATLIAQKV